MGREADIFDALVHHRRAVRAFEMDGPFDHEAVARSIERAILSPTSSNLQLWEFHRVRSAEKRQQLAAICLGQRAATTARELVVVVVRKDLWRQRCRAVLQIQREAFERSCDGELSDRQQRALQYWRKVVPFVYISGLGLFDVLKWVLSRIVGLFRPTPRELSSAAMWTSAHRSVALGAMTFMLSMASEGLDTCPIEGHDSARIKRLLGLPW